MNRCVRGIGCISLWLLYYRSKTSDLRYERGVLSGKRYHALLDPDTEVATARRFATMRDRLLRKFPHRSIRDREPAHSMVLGRRRRIGGVQLRQRPIRALTAQAYKLAVSDELATI